VVKCGDFMNGTNGQLDLGLGYSRPHFSYFWP